MFSINRKAVCDDLEEFFTKELSKYFPFVTCKAVYEVNQNAFHNGYRVLIKTSWKVTPLEDEKIYTQDYIVDHREHTKVDVDNETQYTLLRDAITNTWACPSLLTQE